MDSPSKILLLNGPNLNLLGRREPDRYGHETLAEIEAHLTELAAQLALDLDCLQSNSETQLIERIHAAASDGTAYIIFNPAAFTHTSIALRDALLGVALPFGEVHLSNVHAREDFRRHSYFSDIADFVICGCGAAGYELALRSAARNLTIT